MSKWWRLTPEDLAGRLATDAGSGLTAAEAARRLAEHGPNRLQEGKGKTAIGTFLEQFADFMIWVLIAAALVSGFLLREWVDAIAIIAIVVLNAVLGFVQEHRAERSLQALRRMAAPMSRVVRDGGHLQLPACDLVAGDLIELEAGDHVPADARVVGHTANFAVQEAGLTGESTPVLKSKSALDREDMPLGDRANMIFMGTSAVAGKARAIVVETGMRTELGKIAGMIQGVGREATPLQKRLEQFGKFIVAACFGLVGLVFLLGLLRGGKVIDLFLSAVSLAVAAIPEGLPAVETLGCATVICSDKTGTLTRNEMTVRAVVTARRSFEVTGTGYEPKGAFLLQEAAVDPAAEADLREALKAAVLCNGASLAQVEGRWTVVGDPTEGALLTCAAKAGWDKAALEAAEPFLDEIPFDSERKRMTILRRTGQGSTAYVKGAPDVLLERCRMILENGRERPFGKADAAEVLKATTALSEQALRVLAVARRSFPGVPDASAAEAVESDLTFLGLAAMIDPPRQEAREAVSKCRASGIITVMITGDHKATAAAIGRELGMADADTLAMTGEELDALSEPEFEKRVDHTRVYARVAPEHKLRVVKAWRRRGAVVAMTGDGVNDAPAVKEADIGVAMGMTGTDVTKEVSDMIITDDNFASIVAAVEEGRGIYDNIKKFIHYLLSCNMGEILVMLVASLLGWAVPLLPIQLLWVNLITDGLPALALGMEPVDRDIMRRPPRRADEPIVNRARGLLILAQGAFIGFCALLAFCFVLFVEKEGLDRARTAALIALASAQLFHAFNCRCQRTSLFKLGLFSNPKLLLASGLSLLLQFGIIYLPFAQKIFKVVPLGPVDILVLVLISSFPLWAMELIKAIPSLRRRLPEA